MNTIKQYFSGVFNELKKISWPNRATIINHTIIVLISSLIAMGVVAAIDYGLTGAIKYYLTLNQG